MASSTTTRVLFGSASSAADISGDVREWTLNQSVESFSTDPIGRKHMDKTPHSIDVNIALSGVYYGPIVEQLRQAAAGSYAFVVAEPQNNVGVWVGGQSFVDGVPETVPTQDAITSAVTFRPTEKVKWTVGTVVVPFSLNSGDTTSVELGAGIDAGWKGFVVVTGRDAPASALQVTAAGQAVNLRAGQESGIFLVSFASAQRPNATVAASLSGQATVSGFLLVGTDYNTPEGSR